MKASVIVCTRNRSKQILSCLDSIIVAITFAVEPAIEIVVIDNGSTDDTYLIVNAWIQTVAYPVKLVLEQQTGLAAARNRAIAESSGELLIFTDDDCRLDPTYIATALNLHTADGANGVLRGGRVELGDPTDLPVSVLTSREPMSWQVFPRTGSKYLLGVSIIGANLSFSRDVAELVGDFDERFGAGGIFPGGEEIDYVYRAYSKNVRIEYCPILLVIHFHGRKTMISARALVVAYNKGDGALLAKHFFNNTGLLRQFFWDVKKAVKELFGGSLSRPDLQISHWSRLLSISRGFCAYALIAFLKKLGCELKP